jgi:thiosulfate reductase cytochrome b subunit
MSPGGNIRGEVDNKVKPGHSLVHPAWLRLAHWVNVLAVVILVMSGWKIYNASPVFRFLIPGTLTLGGWLGGALLWHFAAMWVLVANGVVYLVLNLLSGRMAARFFPLRFTELLRDSVAALKGRLSHDNPQHYNAPQKLAYLFVIADTTLIVVSGLVVWKSVQFPHLRALMGGYDSARVVHFVAMTGLVIFVAVHVVMVALVPKTFLMIIRGR